MAHRVAGVRGVIGFGAALAMVVLLAVGVLPVAEDGATVHAASHADRAAGEALFHEKGCEHCHGATLLGTERGPMLTGVGRKLHGDGIRHQIEAGGGGMPAFGDVLAPDEISRLVDYLESQKKRPKAGLPAPAAKAPKLPANGSDDQS